MSMASWAHTISSPAHAIVYFLQGEMSEWFKETVLKTVVPATVPRVRIPVSPPQSKKEAMSGVIVGDVPRVSDRPQQWSFYNVGTKSVRPRKRGIVS